MARYPDLKRDYQDRGFAIARGFIPHDEVRHIRGEVERYIRDIAPSLPPTDLIREADGASIRNLFRMDEHDSFFRELGGERRFAELLEELMADEPMLRAVQTFNKPARVGSAVPQHQDNAYFSLHPPTAGTLWIALDPATAENGAVRYVVGSHRLGSLAHRYSGQPGNSMMMKHPLDPSGYEAVQAILDPGDVVIHHCRTVHYSGPNRSELPRLGMAIPYQGKRATLDPELKRLYDEVAARTGRPLHH